MKWRGTYSRRVYMGGQLAVISLVVLPLTVALPAYISNPKPLLFHVFCIAPMFAIIAVLQPLSISQMIRAYQSYSADRRENVQARKDELERRRWEDHKQQQVRLKAEAREKRAAIISRKERDLGRLCRCTGCKFGGKRMCHCVCLRRSLCIALATVVLLVLPLLVVVPVAASSIDLSHTFTSGQSSVLLWIATLAPPAATLARLVAAGVRYLRRWKDTKAATGVARTGVIARDSFSFARSNTPASMNDTAQADADANVKDGINNKRASKTAEQGRVSRTWSLTTLFGRGVSLRLCGAALLVWFFAVLPLLIGFATRSRLEHLAWPSHTVHSDTVKNILWIFGLTAPFIYVLAVGAHLSTQACTYSSLVTEDESRNRELNNLGIAQRNDWPLELAGEYPYWSLGHGLVTLGIRETPMPPTLRLHPATPIPSFFMLVVVPLAFGLPTYITLGYLRNESYHNSTLGRLVLVLLLGLPSVFTIYLGSVLIWGVLPNAIKRALPWWTLWHFSSFVFPVALGVPLIIIGHESPDVDQVRTAGMALICVAVSCILIDIILIRHNRRGIADWARRLTLEHELQDRVATLGLRIGSVCSMFPLVVFFFALVMVLLRNISGYQRTQYFVIVIGMLSFVSALGVAFAQVCSVFLREIPAHSGLQTTSAVLYVATGILSATYAWSTGDVLVRNENRVQAGGTSFLVSPELFSWVILILAICQNACLVWFKAASYRHRALKRKFGYFPEEWELANPTGRYVDEEAAGVVALPTTRIRTELGRRDILGIVDEYLNREHMDHVEDGDEDSRMITDFAKASVRQRRERGRLENYLERALAVEIELERDALLAHAEANMKAAVERSSQERSRLSGILTGLGRHASGGQGEEDTRKNGSSAYFCVHKGKLRRNNGTSLRPTHAIRIDADENVLYFTNLIFGSVTEMPLADIERIAWFEDNRLRETNRVDIAMSRTSNNRRMRQRRKLQTYYFINESQRGLFCSNLWDVLSNENKSGCPALGSFSFVDSAIVRKPSRAIDSEARDQSEIAATNQVKSGVSK